MLLTFKTKRKIRNALEMHTPASNLSCVILRVDKCLIAALQARQSFKHIHIDDGW